MLKLAKNGMCATVKLVDETTDRSLFSMCTRGSVSFFGKQRYCATNSKLVSNGVGQFASQIRSLTVCNLGVSQLVS